jgi:hypothetical protein
VTVHLTDTATAAGDPAACVAHATPNREGASVPRLGCGS